MPIKWTNRTLDCYSDGSDSDRSDKADHQTQRAPDTRARRIDAAQTPQ